jgi:hypothetical protein
MQCNLPWICGKAYPATTAPSIASEVLACCAVLL